MIFTTSSQARSWIFSEESFSRCRKRAVSQRTNGRVRKFASGFDQREHHFLESSSSSSTTTRQQVRPEETSPAGARQSSKDQDILVHFHSHHITNLIGPNAVLPELVRSPKALATAVILFRRFFLSNSVADFRPRTIALAACLLASKVEEERIQIGSLQRASTHIFGQVQSLSPSQQLLCRRELAVFPTPCIEAAERQLLEGVNYELICHHPHDVIAAVAPEISDRHLGTGHRQPRESVAVESSRNIFDHPEFYQPDLEEKALDVAQNALLFSDVPFLFPPGQIALAAIALAATEDESPRCGHERTVHPCLSGYLRTRFSTKPEREILAFEGTIRRIAEKLRRSPTVDVVALAISRSAGAAHERAGSAQRSEGLRDACSKATSTRSNQEPSGTRPGKSVRKRKPPPEHPFVSPIPTCLSKKKVAKVTPPPRSVTQPFKCSSSRIEYSSGN